MLHSVAELPGRALVLLACFVERSRECAAQRREVAEDLAAQLGAGFAGFVAQVLDLAAEVRIERLRASVEAGDLCRQVGGEQLREARVSSCCVTAGLRNRRTSSAMSVAA